MRYLAVRVLQGVFLLLGVSLLSFVFLEAAPGDFFQEMRLNPQISPNAVARLRAQYGLDQPFPVRYGRWLVSEVRCLWPGDWRFRWVSSAQPGLVDGLIAPAC